MSNRMKIAIIYGVLSLISLGYVVALLVVGDEDLFESVAVFFAFQVLFGFFSMGYSAGRDDQKHKRVRDVDY